jgi:RNA polymerase sigma-70 factor (ECF subfamily)
MDRSRRANKAKKNPLAKPFPSFSVSTLEDRMSSMDEDKKLVERTIKGEKEAFELIIRKYQRPLFNSIGRMVGERELALEFTQDVFLKTYSSLHTYQPQYKFSTWLFKIASNYVIDFWRKKKINTLSLDERQDSSGHNCALAVAADEKSIIRKFEISELRTKIEDVLKEVPPPLREVFIWRHINELSYEEIAEIKGLPVGTVKTRVFHAKELIRKLLEGKK